VRRKKARHFGPAALVLGSFLAAIAAGTALLMIPAATTQEGISLLDALFTATSAICVTGLVVVDTGTRFTGLGQGVILGLIQAGGLGIMTYTVMIYQLFGKSLPFTHLRVLHGTFSHAPREDILSLIRSIFVFTALAELLGTALLFHVFVEHYAPGRAMYLAAFHSVSAFCNAGFSLFPDSFMAYRSDALLNVAVCGLIVTGGIGFPVGYDLYQRALKGRRARLAVQTRVVLWTTAMLIVAGTLLFWLGERDNALHGLGPGEALLTSVFQSVTCRTAGFNTVDIGKLTSATLCFVFFLMFVGASPGSCGGGVKTTTLAVLGAFALSRVRRRSRVNLFHRSIPHETVSRALALVALSASLIFGLFLLLLFTSGHEAVGVGHERFLAYFFELVSAFGTVGLSMGATGELNAWGKGIVILMMFIGRVGVFTFAYLVAGAKPNRGFELAEESVMIG